MQTMHLFAGAGGGLLADLILGHTPIVAVEWDAYACAVLRSRAADGWFPGLQVHEGDVRLFDPSQYAGKVDCIHAGFPCQDISTAGKGAGITGARSGLVSEVFRSIDAIRPEWVMLENSPAIRKRGRHVVIRELLERGYTYRDGVLAASDVGANHRRKRWWLLAHANHPRQPANQGEGQAWDDARRLCEDVPNTKCQGLERPTQRWLGGLRESQETFSWGEPGGAHAAFGPWWASEPDVGRMAHGVANRVDKIKAIGNGQVPLCAAAAWCLLGGPVDGLL